MNGGRRTRRAKGVWLFGGVCAWVVFVAVAAAQEPLAPFEPVTPIPRHVAYDRAKAKLGRRLFFDKDLSLDRTVSCASCHDPAHGGADSRPASVGVRGRRGRVNTPTVLNAALNVRFFWNGQVTDLRRQIDVMLRGWATMGMPPDEVEIRLSDDPRYRRAFREIYGTRQVTYTEVLDVLAEFERALTAPDSRFDRFLRGEADLEPEEAEGYRLFKEMGCIICHNGVNLGGNSLQLPALPSSPFWQRHGVVAGAGKWGEGEKELLRVPGLRNVALTAPYFDTGSCATLEEAVVTVAASNLGVDLDEEETRALVAFLKTLTGRLPGILAADTPVSPASGEGKGAPPSAGRGGTP